MVSVIVPTYRRSQFVANAVRSLFALDYPREDYEVIVVDSSPDTDNLDLLRGLAADAPCAFTFLHKQAEGPGPSRNLGAARARGRFLAFMDSDCQAHPDWLRHSLAAFQPDTGIVQGKTLPDPHAKLGVLTHYPMNEHEYFVYECTNIIYRRSAFEQAGGFPRDQHPNALRPLGGEDVTLAWTVKRNGWSSRFAADSIVYHEVIPVSLWRWVVPWRLSIWPKLVAQFPELRQFFVARYFWDPAQALLALGVAGGTLATTLSGWGLVLALPYLVYRAYPKSRSFPGLLRPLRVLPYLARDSASMILLVTGSLRYRCLLL